MIKGSAWEARDMSAASRAHPYAIAHYLLDGRLPPSEGQFVELTAERDAEGKAVVATCDYALTLEAGTLPRWWSLSAYAGTLTPEGSTVMSPTAVTEADGSLKITVSRHPQPGNWIKAPASGQYKLIFTASESAGASSGKPKTPGLFAIARSGC